jgi:glycerol-3-phosphate dehydrogenase subunit C
MDRIKNVASENTVYNPNDPVYWNPQSLQQEITRVFDICNGCRLCYGLCPSFNDLLGTIDKHDGNIHISAEETDHVIDTCNQCKLCYVKCPYTPDEGHEFQLDYPRLLIRANMLRTQQRGIRRRERVLSRPEFVGKMAGVAAPITNWANRQPLLRSGLQSALGIHKDKLLPDFHGTTFEDWYRSQPKPQGDDQLAVLFHTCFVNYNNPAVGKATVEVFSKNGVSLSCPKQNCCGMPALEAGDFEMTKKLATSNVEALLPQVESGRKIVVINPTCSFMLRQEYPEIVGTEAARKISAATMDLSEFLFARKQQGHFNRDFKSSPGRIAYHLPCHLKAQKIGYRSRDLMRLIPETNVRLVDHCSGHDGTWAMKKEFFPLSLLMGKKAFDGMKEAEPDTLVTDCPLAAIQFDQALGTRPIHPMEVLSRAYSANGFPTPIHPSITPTEGALLR